MNILERPVVVFEGNGRTITAQEVEPGDFVVTLHPYDYRGVNVSNAEAYADAAEIFECGPAELEQELSEHAPDLLGKPAVKDLIDATSKGKFEAYFRRFQQTGR